jgi:hypothetical protein
LGIFYDEALGGPGGMRHLLYIFKYLFCQLRHKKEHSDTQWQVLGIGSRGLVPAPAKWLVWTYCEKCGVGWTRKVEMDLVDWERWVDSLPEGEMSK